MAGLLYVEPKTVILDDEDTAYTPLTQSKEETTVVGPLPLLHNHATHGHLQYSLHSSPHASPRFARIHLSTHPDPSSPSLTPSPSPRANSIPLPSEPQISPRGYMPVSVPYIGGGALDDSDSESGSDNNDEDVVNGSDNVGKPSQETRRISSSFMESSLPKHRTSSFTTDTRSSTSLINPHASSSFSPSPRTTSYGRGIPSPTSPFRLHFSLAIRKGQPSPSPLSKSTVQLHEGSPDSRLVSGERSNGEHDDEDRHGYSNAHSGSDLESRVLDQARSRADRLPHHGHLCVF
ncbi:hypothetical protein BU17DRAFT_79605 [Hysterangium stoloniferum]|nr:hypothetical protein BU17DRAFT_79605 [Hysterangium stoloniferum]